MVVPAESSAREAGEPGGGGAAEQEVRDGSGCFAARHVLPGDNTERRELQSQVQCGEVSIA